MLRNLVEALGCEFKVLSGLPSSFRLLPVVHTENREAGSTSLRCHCLTVWPQVGGLPALSISFLGAELMKAAPEAKWPWMSASCW